MPACVDNGLYRRLGHAWWDEDEGMFATIRHFVHPVRFGYLSGLLAQERARGAAHETVLDVGCGGGFMAEDLARAGLRVTGIDPAPETIATARAHAAASGLAIAYRTGSGEALPFPDAAFDVVVCCDVLEHVEDVGRGVSTWLDFRRRAQGKITFRELGERLAFQESSDLAVSYMGFAIKS